MMIIGLPEVTVKDDKIRLASKVQEEERQYEIWFESDHHWGKYFVSDRIDPFVLLVLPHAMKTNQNIKSEAPISEGLKYKLKNFQIPVCSKYIDINHKIELDAPAIGDLTPNETPHVSTGCSNGVDSLYTVFKNIYDNEGYGSFKINMLSFFSVGESGDFGGEEEEQLALKRKERVMSLAKEMELPVAGIDSNINEIYDDEVFLHVHPYRNMACVLSMQKLYDVYYYSTSCELKDFHFGYQNPAYYDLLNCEDFSTKGTHFYSYGLEASREEKLAYLADFALSKKYLMVCQTDYKNCSRCEKCYRTMAELDLMHKLDGFNDVFDTKYYYANRDKILGWGISCQKENLPWRDIANELRRQRGMTWEIKKYHIYYVLRKELARRFKHLAALYKSHHKNPYEGESQQYKHMYVRL